MRTRSSLTRAVHQAGGLARKGTSMSSGPRSARSHRIHSSLSSSAADAGLNTSHSHRPIASPANTERSKEVSVSLVSTDQSEIGCPSIRIFTCGGAAPGSPPGAGGVRPADRAPRPTPGSSDTTVSSTTPSRSLLPAQVTNDAFASLPTDATQPKSLMAHPGLSGHGIIVGSVPQRSRCSANVSYPTTTGLHTGVTDPWSGQIQPWPFGFGSAVTGEAQRGQPAARVMAQPSCPAAPVVKAPVGLGSSREDG